MNISTLSTIAIPDHASTILSITLLTPRSTVSKSAFPIFPPNQLDRIDAESESNTQSLSPNFPIAHLPPELRTHIYVPYLRSLPCVLLTTSNLHLPLQPQLPLLQASPFFSSDIAERLLWRNVQLGFEEGDVLRTFLKEKQEAVAWVQRVRISVQKSAGVDCDWVVLILGGLRAVREVTFGFELWGG
ncbi:hypothetical protein B7494_g8039 [Chlorociboria aeruginascens]|nr:hypothetical protein B7494_g8039 [Chlorociboria aeruginascens]